MGDPAEIITDVEIAPDYIIEHKGPGRPCKYYTHVKPYLNDVLQWLKIGMNEYSICDKLDISFDAWIEYKGKYSELTELYTRAMRERNCLVYNSMYQKAVGTVAEIKKQKVLPSGTVVGFTEEMYIPADVNAADLYLRNKDPEYKSPKSDNSGSILQVNFQLPQLQAEIKQLDEELKALESHEPVASQGMEE